MPVLPITVRNKVATYSGDIPYVCGNSDYIAAFTFDEEWDSYPQKTARFVYGSSYADVVFTGSECSVPIIESAMLIMIGVFAGNLRTTTGASVRSCYSIRSESGAPENPTPDVYDQIMDELNTHETRLDELEQHGGGGSGYIPPMTGATASCDGSAGLVPAPLAGQQDAVLHGDGTWRKVSGGGGAVSAEIADGGMFLTTTMSVTIAGGGMMIA